MMQKESTGIAKAMRQASQLHRTGRLQDAEAIYQQVLAGDPNHDGALYSLADIARRASLFETAIELLDRAIEINPGDPNYHTLRGQSLRAIDRIDDSIAAYQQALQLKPDSAKVLVSLGIALRKQGQVDQAIAVLRKAIKLRPDMGEAHITLGNVHFQSGQFPQAAEQFRLALRSLPDSAEAHNNLAKVQENLGEVESALDEYAKAVRCNPRYPDAYRNLAALYKGAGDVRQAAEAYGKAIEIRANDIDALLGRGECLLELGDMGNALACYEHVLAHNKESPIALIGSGVIHLVIGQIRKATTLLEASISAHPLVAEAYVNLGGAYASEARLDEAAAAYGQALALSPANREAQSNCLFILNYDHNVEPDRICAEHRLWGESISTSIVPFTGHANGRDIDRRLRVGFVSADFRNHSVAYFLEPLLDYLDGGQFEIICYSNSYSEDAVTQRLRAKSNLWRVVKGLPPKQTAELIHSDGIDILFDLAGHTGGESMLTFAHRPAPVQATYLGYPTTTGLPAIGYRLTDWKVDPPGFESMNTEKPIRMPNSYFCYRPPTKAPDVTPAPCLGNGYITFGSFNSLTKISGPTIDRWAELLKVLPDSKFVIKSKNLADDGIRARFLGQFIDRGIEMGRIELLAWEGKIESHLALYGRVDVALDCFPYNGATTTCEALWMGVPVVTLAGATHAGRMGLSILSVAGLADLVASNPAEYVRIARQLAMQPDRVQSLRQTLRATVSASPLRDENRFARDFGDGLRTMWREWVETPA